MGFCLPCMSFVSSADKKPFFPEFRLYKNCLVCV
nr:hypothetical protein MACL_00001447 [Theileria orientalis]